MRPAVGVFVGVSCFIALANPSAQQARPATPAYDARCSSCHGPAMTGATGPAILAYMRYHTNGEASAQVRAKHSTLQIPDAELQQVLTEVRLLTGTNPSMATGGFTGRRGGGPGGAGGGAAAGAGRGRGGAAPVAAGNAAPTPGPAPTAAPAAAPASSAGIGGTAPTTIKMADGKTRTGILLAQGDIDATLLENGKYVLLSRDGDVYREKAIAPKADWLMYDGSVTGNRFSPIEQINTSNVKRVGPAWMFAMPASPRLEVTPTVVDGIMYVGGWNEWYALDATTGRQLWSYSEPHHEGILSEGGSGANRGVTIAGDKAVVVTDHAHLLGFNRFTGQRVWDVEMGSMVDSYSATSPPLPVGDLLVVGVAGGEEGARGFVDAYRASTGERVWRFYSIPKRGEPGSETWIGQALEHGCGATWMPGSYDPTLDLVYWAIGNPCPDIAGEERIGDNLYTSSVVALSAKTGALKWYYQFTPHDTHDWDAVQPMLLVDEVWQGRPRKLLMHGDRNGMFYVLDRATGEFLLGDNLSTKVTWLKGFTKEGKPIVDPASIASLEGAAACPAGGGGANWPAASYNPISKLFYTRVADGCALFTSHEDPLGATGNRWFGRGTPSAAAQEKLRALLAGYKTGTYIRAMNPFTGKKVWDYPAPAGRSGVLSTAGGLLFVGGGGGLLALDAKTGKALWNVNVAQNTSATPMTYMVGGRQYIALPGTGVIVAYALY
ncbi:MAG TPA: PQQ-binding-like beta-propeller repeat protein [Vicinamibacterales bacterium]|nr:PQQ-binding-like beta-propeller repeat protein [Vicinamibacterales bacterium]